MNKIIEIFLKTKPYSFLFLAIFSVMVWHEIDSYSGDDIKAAVFFGSFIWVFIAAIIDVRKYKLIPRLKAAFMSWKFRDVFVVGVAISFVFCVLLGVTQVITSKFTQPKKKSTRVDF